MKKRVLSIVLALCMVLTLLPNVALAEGEGTVRWGAAGTGGSAPESWTIGTLAQAMTYANGLGAGTAYIQLLADIDNVNHTVWPLTFEAGKTTTLDLNGKDINRGLVTTTVNGNVITVSGTLTLRDSSTSTVADQGDITGGFISSMGGGGVFVDNNGSFTMEGGNIIGNKCTYTNNPNGGGGVCVNTTGNFMMQGGSIKDNQATNWGGGVYANGSFTMTGGTITGNSASMGGVWFNGTFSVGGSAVIDDNFRSFAPFAEANVVRYSNNLPILIITPITTARIGFTQYWYTPTGDNPFNITSNNSADYSSNFFSDNNIYTIQNSGSGNTQVVQLTDPRANLSALALSSGTLAPVFASGIRTYTASVENAVSSITVTPTVAESNATFTVNGVAVISGNPSGAIALNVGANTITVVVTAQNGTTTTTKTYTVTVTRAAANPAKAITAFNFNTLTPNVTGTVNEGAKTIALTVPYGTDVTELVPTITQTGASVSPNTGVAQNFTNPVTYTVTAADSSTQAYTVTVTVAASNDADLSAFALSSGTLDPVFASGTTSYTASVGSAISSITVTPTVAESHATITVDGVAVISDNPSGAIALNVGANTITVVVTAQNGTTTKTYTVTVTRAAANPAKAITAFNFNTLTPNVTGTVNEGAKTIALTVPYGTDVTELVPTITQTGASVSPNTGAAQNFTNPVTYTVTAADSSTQAYTVTVTVAASNDADLSAFALSSGTLDPVFASGTTSYTASVENAISTITVTPTVAESNATFTVNGVAVISGNASGVINLNVGANIIPVVVTAQDGTTTKTYTVTVTRAASSGGGSSTTPQTTQKTVIVIVNGQQQDAGKETRTTEDGKSTITVEVKKEVIDSKIDEAIKNNTTGTSNVIQIPVDDTKSEVAKVELTGDIVRKLEENKFDVSVKRDNVEYIIPAEEFTISKVAVNLGVKETDLKEIKVEVIITKLDEKVVEKYNAVAKANGDELVFLPVSFQVVAKTTKADGSTGEVKISNFSNYVERVMEIPAGVDPSKITTGIVFNPDGTYSHVPTSLYQKDGKWYAMLNSLTNSSYSVIWNPVTVKSVVNHWVKDAVNDMASRLVIFNPEKFEPNKAITRADFAEYIVRALGLYREGSTQENKFKDLSSKGERTLAILIANEYGIVRGYTDETFRPDQEITREEAMVMYQRAMKITKLVGMDQNRYQNYTDYTKVSSWAETYVKEVLSAHVFNGTSTTTISPKSNLTYAEAAQAIKNLLVESKLINK